MPPAAFDPCKKWLGIDAVDLADPRKVLGVSASESDPHVVSRAAEIRIATLRGVEPGPFDRARDALLRRVEEARDSLLAQSLVPSPAKLSMPPPPGGQASYPLPSAVAPPVVPGVPAIPTIPRPPSAWPESGADVVVDMPYAMEARQRPVYRRQSGHGAGIALLIGALAATVGGLYWYKFHGTSRAEKRGSRPVEVARNDQVRPADAEKPPAKLAPEDRPGRSRMTETDRGSQRESPRAEPTETPAPAEPSPPSDPPRMARTTSEPRPEPAFPAPEPAPAAKPPADATPDSSPPATAMPARPPLMTPPAEPGTVPGPQPDPAPMPSPKPTPTEPEAPAEDTKRIDQSLRKAADALHEADFATAEAAVRQAAAAATMKESRQRVECWNELVTFAKGFADFREQALKSVQTGNEFDVDDKKVAVVEIDDTKFVYRYAGKNFTRPRDRIPGGIVMAIVEAWFDEKPANDLFIGAYHASKAEPDFDKARLAWERAQGRGADASLLLPLLDDPLLQPAAE